MSKLNDLIKELCPDGVEYKPLDSFATIVRGNGLQKKDFTEDGVGCIHYGQIYTYYGTYAYETKSKVSVELAETLKKVETGDLVVAVTSENIEDVCKCVAWLGEETIVTGGHAAIIKHKQNSKYLAYYFQTEDFYKQKVKIVTGTKVMDIAPSKMGKIIIPIPPLPVQCEIVRILDNFTALTSALTAELTAQRKRYSGLLNSLLSFEGRDAQDGVLWKKLGDIAVNLDSRRIAVTKHNRKAGIYPYYGASGIVDYVDDYIFDGDFLLVSEDGANLVARSTPIAFSITGKNWVNNHAHVLKFDNIYLQKYVEIYLNLLDLSPYISKGAQPKLSQTSLKKIILPIPDDSRIRYVVDILDRFDKLCNDLSEGLPAEIAARQKQYEYYRDKLLTFKEKEA